MRDRFAGATPERLGRLNRAIGRATDPDEPWPARKKAARAAAAHAERCGILLRPKFCERCGERVGLEKHHPDHGRPLVVRFVFRVCHRELDEPSHKET